MLKTLRILIHDLKELKEMLSDAVLAVANAAGALEAEVASMQTFIQALKDQIAAGGGDTSALEAQLNDATARLQGVVAALQAMRA